MWHTYVSSIIHVTYVHMCDNYSIQSRICVTCIYHTWRIWVTRTYNTSRICMNRIYHTWHICVTRIYIYVAYMCDLHIQYVAYVCDSHIHIRGVHMLHACTRVTCHMRGVTLNFTFGASHLSYSRNANHWYPFYSWACVIKTSQVTLKCIYVTRSHVFYACRRRDSHACVTYTNIQ